MYHTYLFHYEKPNPWEHRSGAMDLGCRQTVEQLCGTIFHPRDVFWGHIRRASAFFSTVNLTFPAAIPQVEVIVTQMHKPAKQQDIIMVFNLRVLPPSPQQIGYIRDYNSTIRPR